MKPNVIQTLDTRSDAKKAFDNAKADLEVVLESVRITSTIAAEQYKSLLENGFTEHQAMEIITTQPAWK